MPGKIRAGSQRKGREVAQPLSHLLPAAEWPRGQGRMELNLQDTQAISTSSAGMARTHLHPGGHGNVPIPAAAQDSWGLGSSVRATRGGTAVPCAGDTHR